VLEKKGLSLEQISHPEWFQKDPSSAWGFYAHRAELYQNAKPHEGFHILRQLVQMKKENYFIFTSNVDSQFQKAGFEEERLYECHGSLGYLQCSKPCGDRIWESTFLPQVNPTTLKTSGEFPKCKCGAVARPNVSLFGDTNDSWIATRAEAQRYRLLKWLSDNYPYSSTGKFEYNDDTSNNINTTTTTTTSTSEGLTSHKRKLVIIECGSGTSLHSIRIESEALLLNNYLEHDKGESVKLIRLNPNDYDCPVGHIGIGLGAKEALKEIAIQLGINKQEVEENKTKEATTKKGTPMQLRSRNK